MTFNIALSCDLLPSSSFRLHNFDANIISYDDYDSTFSPFANLSPVESWGPIRLGCWSAGLGCTGLRQYPLPAPLSYGASCLNLLSFVYRSLQFTRAFCASGEKAAFSDACSTSDDYCIFPSGSIPIRIFDDNFDITTNLLIDVQSFSSADFGYNKSFLRQVESRGLIRLEYWLASLGRTGLRQYLLPVLFVYGAACLYFNDA